MTVTRPLANATTSPGRLGPWPCTNTLSPTAIRLPKPATDIDAPWTASRHPHRSTRGSRRIRPTASVRPIGVALVRSIAAHSLRNNTTEHLTGLQRIFQRFCENIWTTKRRMRYARHRRPTFARNASHAFGYRPVPHRGRPYALSYRAPDGDKPQYRECGHSGLQGVGCPWLRANRVSASSSGSGPHRTGPSQFPDRRRGAHREAGRVQPLRRKTQRQFSLARGADGQIGRCREFLRPRLRGLLEEHQPDEDRDRQRQMSSSSPITGLGPLSQAIATAASGMRAQTLRLRTVAENLANANSTAATPGDIPYQRKMTTFEQEVETSTCV